MINACANTMGTIPLQLIGKAKGCKCFRGAQMDLQPVEYKGHWPLER